MWIERSIAQTLMFVLVILLVACGGGKGPNERDISQAYLKAFPTTQAFDGIKVEENTKSDQGGYLVIISYDTAGGRGELGDPQGHYTVRLAMTKSGNEWIITKMDMLGMGPLPEDVKAKIEKAREEAMTPTQKTERALKGCMTSMSGLECAIDVYQADHGTYPAWTVNMDKNAFSSLGSSKKELVNIPTFIDTLSGHYLKSLPQDPYSPVNGATYAYWTNIPMEGTTLTAGETPIYLLWSPGPDKVYDLNIEKVISAHIRGTSLKEYVYDPTNGAASRGDLVRTDWDKWQAQKDNTNENPGETSDVSTPVPTPAPIPSPMADPSVPLEKYGALTGEEQLATLYHALSGKPVDYEKLAPIFSEEYQNSTDAFQKKDLLNALKPQIDQKIAFFGDQKNHYLKIELQGYLSHYNFSDKSFPVSLPNTEPNSYIFFGNSRNYKMGFTNGEKYAKALVPEEEKARLIEARISEGARSGSLPVRAIVFVFAQKVESEDTTIHSQVVKIQLFGRNNKQDDLIVEY